MARSPSRRHHAVVIGSGLAGLCAARVLADHFERVTVLERDRPSDDETPRKGAPQGGQAHALLKRGERILERLFPGFVDEIEDRGAHLFDFGSGVRWLHHGVWKARFDSRFPVHVQTRPLVEGRVRARLQANPRLGFRYGCTVEGLETEGHRITGVAIREARGARSVIAADLVVDASGRGSRLPAWLEAMGLAAPREDRFDVDLCYATRMYEAPEDMPADWRALLIYGQPPYQTRTGFLFPVEGGRWLVTLVGYLGDHPPADAAGFDRFAASLPSDELSRAIAGARPLGPVRRYRFTHAAQRRYDRLRRLPEGLLALGDAVCSFDPVFGQGMTMAARNAELLDHHLRRGRLRPRRWFRALRRMNAVPWVLAATEGLRFPQLAGCRPPGLGLLQAYCRRVFRLCGHDTAVYRRFLRVLQMVAGPWILFHPRVVWAVLRHRDRPRPLRTGKRPLALLEAGHR